MIWDRVATVEGAVPLLVEGYGWLPNRRRRSDDGVVRTRLLGRRAVGLCGPEAAQFFYDDRHVRRHGAVPELVRGSLFGDDGVQMLDGGPHRSRKALFRGQLGAGEATVTDRVTRAWRTAVPAWTGRRVSVFDEAARALAAGVLGWAGVPVDSRADTDAWAADLVAMVDGFATLGPRHWRARAARGRREWQLAALVDRVRRGEHHAGDTPLAAVSDYREHDGSLLSPGVAAVELLNLVRPTVAVGWYVAYAAHALHRWPEHREPLQAAEPGYAGAFAQEVRRFYPFAPFVGGLARRELSWRGHEIPAGTMVLLDLYGQNHDPALWPEPYRFAPRRFADLRVDVFTLVPQGGGDPVTSHRCPGDDLTVALVGALVPELARLDYRVPRQDLSIPLSRIPARVRSGMMIEV